MPNGLARAASRILQNPDTALCVDPLWLERGMVFCAFRGIDLISRMPLVRTGAVLETTNSFGLGTSLDGGNSKYLTLALPVNAGACNLCADISVFWQGTISAGSAMCMISCAVGAGTGTSPFILRADGSTPSSAALSWGRAGSNYVLYSSSLAFDIRSGCFGVTARVDKGPVFYGNGVMSGGMPDVACTPTWDGSSTIMFGRRADAGAYLTGVMNLAFGFRQALTQHEATELTTYPWQVLRTEPNRTYFLGPSGLTFYPRNMGSSLLLAA